MRMSLAQRVLLTWLFTLLFLIMLVLKLDEKAPWNWFLIFIPVWIFDTILLVMLIVKMAGRCKSGFDPRHGSHNIKKKAWYLIAMLLKLAFCLALCAKLEQFTTMNLSYVFIPLLNLCKLEECQRTEKNTKCNFILLPLFYMNKVCLGSYVST
uniref:Transmembrane protein 60 n=1 Tax=Capra hircus TaxID=9925 RepID=A0A8C2RIG8_CAPHI